MKNRYPIIILSCFFSFCCSLLHAQMVGDNVFLQGRYVEVGIAPNGGYGTTLPAPAGYHPYLGGTVFTFWDPGSATAVTSGNLLGFVADYGADGWTVGTPPFFGDFYLPGTPQEGWAIKIGTGLEADAYIPAYWTSTAVTGYTGGLSGTNTGYSNSGGVIKGIWNGSDGGLAIRQTTILDTNKLYFTVNVVLRNTTSATLPNIYYIRTVDPDNEETRTETCTTCGGTGNYTTINTITDQLPNPSNKVLVSATGVTYTNAYLGLGTKDCRAKAVIFNGGGLTPGYSPDTIYNQTGNPSYLYAQGATNTEDVGIGLVYNLGPLAAGDSTDLTYAYILNATYIDSALNATQPSFKVNGTVFDSLATINLCSYPIDSIVINLENAGFYHWTWAPDSFLANNSGGVSNVIHSDSITSNIVYTITGTDAAGGCTSVTYHLSLLHATFPGPATIAASYCQYAPSVPLTAVGSTGTLTWWTMPSGGTGASSITPSTFVPGTQLYYVSEAFGLCQSARAPDTVVTIPLPPPPYLFDPTPYCDGQAFVPITVGGTGVLWYAALTGGVGGATAPTVNTSIPGTDTFYASQTVNGCEGPRQTLTITVLDPIIPVFSYSRHYGCNGDTVVFTNSSINGLRYDWDFGDGNTDTAKNPTHIYHSQDSFKVRMIAINAQCDDSMVKIIPLIHPLHAAFTLAPQILCQDSLVTFTDASVGTGLSYKWFFGNGATANSPNTTYTYNNSGTYLVKEVITDFVPCNDTATGIVYVDSLSAINLAVTDSAICKSTYITFTGTFTNIGNTGVTWYFGDGDSIKGVNPVIHAYEAAGTYIVSVRADFRACKDTFVSKSVTVVSAPNVNLGADTTICPGSEAITLTDLINAQNPDAKWLWSTGQTTPSIAITAPGYYSLIVGVGGCYSTDTIWVQNDCYMNIPNVFTPNNDGLNDYFFPRQYLTKGLAGFKMDIYNRWGQLIFETTTLDGSGWDGRLNNVDQPEGVYVYIIDATFKDGQKEHHQGNVTLLR